MKRPRGRPPAEKTMKQIAIRIDQDLLDEIDEAIEAASSGPFSKIDRSAVLRDMLAEGWPVVKAKLKQ